MQTGLPEVLAFVANHASLEDLEQIRNAHVRRLHRLQRDAVESFEIDEKVLFVKDGIEQPAKVVRINRHTLTLCLGNLHHVRCSASFLKKLPATFAVASPE